MDRGAGRAFGRLLVTSPRFRQLEARFSVIWAGAFLAECGARVTIAIILPVNTVVWLSTVLSVGCIGAGVFIGGLVADRMEKLVSAEAVRTGADHQNARVRFPSSAL